MTFDFISIYIQGPEFWKHNQMGISHHFAFVAMEFKSKSSGVDPSRFLNSSSRFTMI